MNVLVTGSSSGIGETVAKSLVEAGHQVVMMARRAEKLKALANDFNANGPGRAEAVPGDVGVWADCERAVDVGMKAFGRLDALVNAAGTWVEAPFVEVRPEALQHFIQTDVTGAAQISRAILPAFQKSGGLRLV